MYQHSKSERSYRNNWIRVSYRVRRKRGEKSKDIIKDLVKRVHRSPKRVEEIMYGELEIDKGTGTKRRRIFRID